MDDMSDHDEYPPQRSTPARGRDPPRPMSSRTSRTGSVEASLFGNARSSAVDPSSSFIPRGLNWLNVPDSVQDSFCALDIALINARKENKRLERHVQKIETRLAEVGETMERLCDLLETEKQKSLVLRREIVNLSSLVAHQDESNRLEKPNLDKEKDDIVARAVLELKQLFRPEELKQTLQKVEMATRQPNHLTKRVEALEHFRQNMLARNSAGDQARRTQKLRLEEASTALRKFSI